MEKYHQGSKGLTDVPGVKVGHSTQSEAATGCSVVLFDKQPARAAGITVGMASSHRQCSILDPFHSVGQIDSIFFTGGSAFGLDAAAGVMKYLRENKRGFATRAALIPTVPTAAIYDLGIGRSDIWPDAQMGYQACLDASNKKVDQGSIGAGTGATVGKLMGYERAMKGGIGSASFLLSNGAVIAALAVVNAFGDVVDPNTGKIVAGLSPEIERSDFPGTLETMLQQGSQIWGQKEEPTGEGAENTTLLLLLTNIELERVQLFKMAHFITNALYATIKPAGTPADGDLIIAASLGEKSVAPLFVSALACRVVEQAILNAVKLSKP